MYRQDLPFAKNLITWRRIFPTKKFTVSATLIGRRRMEKLQEKLAELQKEQKAKQVNAAWREHTRIIRGESGADL